MGNGVKRNTDGLRNHSAKVKKNTEEKVNSTIDVLKRSKTKKINFKTVSELSGVSTTTLYNNPVLRERISSLRALKISKQDSNVPEVSPRDRIRELQRDIQKLKGEKQMLIAQLVETEHLKNENQRLKELLSQNDSNSAES